MANQIENVSDLEFSRLKKCLNGIIKHKKTVDEDRKRLGEELSHLDPEDIIKLFQRQNGSIKYNSTLPEKYRKLSVDLDVMYEQFTEFIKNAMGSSDKVKVVSTPLTSLVCDGENDPVLVLRQPENNANGRMFDDAEQTGGRIIEEVAISGDSETIRTVFGESCSIRPQSRFGIDWAKWFPPVTSRTFLSHYLPASGAAFHIIYTIHLFSPNIISGLFSTSDLAVSNTILFTANVGLGFYVYFRRHLHRVNLWERLEFSVLTSTLFNFVSSRAAVSFKAIFPAKTQTWLKTLFATSLSVYLLSRAYRHLAILDAKSSRPSEANEVFTKEL
ncbi:unnamed protein product [Caenorhabditis angaria]|uniref:Uncharacterized protein n=1 Tax=Caenorhabditis angaria TaxID=860376 RepID=A0A9P1IFM6_9PELO|nr:unnamed protein product [Caenorhabditis angaria]